MCRKVDVSWCQGAVFPITPDKPCALLVFTSCSPGRKVKSTSPVRAQPDTSTASAPGFVSSNQLPASVWA